MAQKPPSSCSPAPLKGTPTSFVAEKIEQLPGLKGVGAPVETSTSADVANNPAICTSASPATGSTAVDRAAPIVFTFNKAIQTAGFAWTIAPTLTGATWTATWNAYRTQVTLSHDVGHPFANETQYTITATDYPDDNGTPARETAVTIFTTADTVAPAIILTSPADGALNVIKNNPVVITFNDNMDPDTLEVTIDPAVGTVTPSWFTSNTVLSLAHANDFASYTDYTVEVTACDDTSGNHLTAGAIPNPFTFKSIDYVPATCTVVPATGAVDVAIESRVVFTFSEEMSTTRCVVTHNLPGTVTEEWNEAKTILSVYSDVDLAINTAYTVTVAGGDGYTHPPDAHGCEMESDPTTTFTTEVTDLPAVVDKDPDTDEYIPELDHNIVIRFSEAMKTGASDITFSCTKNGGGAVTLSDPSWDETHKIVTFTHAAAFDDLAQYDCSLTKALDVNDKDIAAAVNWSFHTDVEPEVSSVDPASAEVVTVLTDSIIITFDKPMKTDSLAFACTKDGGGAVTLDAVAWSVGNTVATYAHAAAFDDDSTYNCNLSAAESAGGTSVEVLPYLWSFTTNAP